MQRIFLIVALCFWYSSAFAGMRLEAVNHMLGGQVRGFGILAEYPNGGPGEITVTRQMTVPKNPEPMPDYCLLKVFDPSGKVAAVCNLGGQDVPLKSYTVETPSGPAGIWRISILNGRDRDRFGVELKSTPVWGIRGEMALGLTSALPERMYLYLPPQTRALILESFGFSGPQPVISFDGKELGSPKPSARRCFTVIEQPPAGKVVTVDLKSRGGAIAFDGAPGLLCPTAEAAEKLRGGTVEAAGMLTAGPFQARVRKAMNQFTPDDFKVDLKLVPVPDDLKNPRLECLFFGKYGPLNSFNSAASKQILDPASPWFGANANEEIRGKLVDWRTGLHGAVLSPFDALALANMAATPGKLNPLYENRQVVNRAVLSAFYHLVSLQGDDVMREGDFQRGNYPMTHVFFVYYNLAHGLDLLKDKLDPAARELWTEGVCDIGDKLVDFTAYESNQWSHVICGHLNVYMATGEKRFLKYFEQLMNAYLDNSFGPASKFGQHPAGFFLEEYGPDGNYDHLNMYSLVNCYYQYRELPGADPKLVEKMRRGIEKNLEFKRFFWLPQPDGSLTCPTALNCRTNGQLCNPSYPGDYLTAPEFDLGFTRYQLVPPPLDTVFPASVFPHLTTTDEWAMRLIRQMTAQGPNSFQLDGFAGAWTNDIRRAWSLPQKAKKVELPFQAEHGVWELPGLVAWKDGAMYGMVFYDVADSRGELRGITGGAPSVLWSKGTGSVFCSMLNQKSNGASSADDLTWACVFSEEPKGKLFFTGKDHGVLTWLKKGAEFVIDAPVRHGDGKVGWRYAIAPGKLRLTVTLSGSAMKHPVLNLPVLVSQPGISLKGPEKGEFKFICDGSLMRVTYPEALEASLTPEIKTANSPVRCLRIPFPANGELEITVEAGTNR